jgi:putative endonuclease
MASYYFYLALCADGSLYAGTCSDLVAREKKHNAGKGARYTRGRGPVRFVYHEAYPTFSEACRREAEVKRWRKSKKSMLIAGHEL